VKKLKTRRTFSGPLIVFFGLILFFAIFARGFGTLSNAQNIIRQGSVLALVAFGQTFVILLAGIDLSVGALMGLTTCTTAVLMLSGVNPVVSALLALAIVTVCGMINGAIVNYLGLNAFVATFGMWGMALGVALVLTNEGVMHGFPDTFRVLHDGMVIGIPVPLIIVLGFYGLLHTFLRYIPRGSYMYAIGGNPEAARLSGINVKLQSTLAYGFSGFMAGIAGILFLARANSAAAVDTIGFEFDSICAVVLGGTALAGGKGGVTQTLIGVGVYTILRNGMNILGVNLYLQLVLVGIILISAYILENRHSLLAGTRFAAAARGGCTDA